MPCIYSPSLSKTTSTSPQHDNTCRLTRSRFGPFTVAAALVFLLVAVLSAGSSRRELIPWLPLFMASVSLMTVAIHEIAQHVGSRPLSVGAEDAYTGASIEAWSERSLRTLSTRPSPPPLLESSRGDPLYFERHGPPSRLSHRTGADATDISLSSVVAQRRPDWDAETRSYFPDDASLPAEDPQDAQDAQNGQEDSRAGTASPGEEESRPESNPDDSDDETVGPSDPLLGQQ
jgi:hypothetical protein